jgi:RNA polymerase sigma-70 factor (ECF subfamily)
MDATAASMDSLLRLVAAWDAGGSARAFTGHDRSPARDNRIIKGRNRIKDTSRTIDNSLIKGFLATGSHEDFEGLVDRHKDRVHRLVVSVLGPRLSAEAEDITQDVFVQVYHKLGTFRMRSSFSTWLFRIAFNKAVEHRRKARNRLPHCSVDSLAALLATDVHADPARAVIDQQRQRRVLQCVEELDEPYRTVVYMHYWSFLSVSDIAAYLGIKTGTVKSHLHRARAFLASTLKREARDE